MAAPPLTDEDAFAQEVRDFLRDHKELNRLIAGEETSSRMIKFCVWLAVDDWNTRLPLSSQTVSNFPSRPVLLYLTIIHILTSVGILKSRNRFRYNDGGFSVDTETQSDEYLRWIQLLKQVSPASDARIDKLKIALNIEGGWGAGVGSDYGWLNGWYGSA